MQYRLTIPYRVQLSTSNGVQADSGVVDADVLHSLQLTRAFGENDPLKIIGAAKIKELVWHEDAFAIGFNFGLLTSLVKTRHERGESQRLTERLVVVGLRTACCFWKK